jgi:hypothetical protein
MNDKVISAKLPNTVFIFIDNLGHGELGRDGGGIREEFPAYAADRLSAVKWRDWKMHLIRQENMYGAPLKRPLPRPINFLINFKKERDVHALPVGIHSGSRSPDGSRD